VSPPARAGQFDQSIRRSNHPLNRLTDRWIDAPIQPTPPPPPNIHLTQPSLTYLHRRHRRPNRPHRTKEGRSPSQQERRLPLQHLGSRRAAAAVRVPRWWWCLLLIHGEGEGEGDGRGDQGWQEGEGEEGRHGQIRAVWMHARMNGCDKMGVKGSRGGGRRIESRVSTLSSSSSLRTVTRVSLFWKQAIFQTGAIMPKHFFCVGGAWAVLLLPPSHPVLCLCVLTAYPDRSARTSHCIPGCHRSIDSIERGRLLNVVVPSTTPFWALALIPSPISMHPPAHTPDHTHTYAQRRLVASCRRPFHSLTQAAASLHDSASRGGKQANPRFNQGQPSVRRLTRSVHVPTTTRSRGRAAASVAISTRNRRWERTSTKCWA
jgi:hypothetical protein